MSRVVPDTHYYLLSTKILEVFRVKFDWERVLARNLVSGQRSRVLRDIDTEAEKIEDALDPNVWVSGRRLP